MLLFLNVGGNRPRTVVSHPFSAAYSFLPWAASKSPSLSCGTLLIAVWWAVSTGRPSPLPLFHTWMSSMLHGDPEDSCVVIVIIFPLWVKVVCTWSPIRGAQHFIGCSPRMGFPDTSLKWLGKSEWRVCLTPQSWPGEPHWWTLCQFAVSCFLRWWLLPWVLAVSFLMRWLQWWSHVISVLMETAIMVFSIRPSMWNCSYSTAFWLHKDSKVAVILSFFDRANGCISRFNWVTLLIHEELRSGIPGWSGESQFTPRELVCVEPGLTTLSSSDLTVLSCLDEAWSFAWSDIMTTLCLVSHNRRWLN